MIQGNLFNLEDIVYMKHDPDQEAWFVDQVRQNHGNVFTYSLVRGTREHIAAEAELSLERDIVKSLKND